MCLALSARLCANTAAGSSLRAVARSAKAFSTCATTGSTGLGTASSPLRSGRRERISAPDRHQRCGRRLSDRLPWSGSSGQQTATSPGQTRAQGSPKGTRKIDLTSTQLNRCRRAYNSGRLKTGKNSQGRPISSRHPRPPGSMGGGGLAPWLEGHIVDKYQWVSLFDKPYYVQCYTHQWLSGHLRVLLDQHITRCCD